MDVHEVLMTTCGDTDSENKKSTTGVISLWEYKTANCLFQYKNGEYIGRHMIAQLNNDYFIGTNPKTPKLYLWQLNSHDPSKNFRLNLPANASCLSVCPHGVYLAVGIRTYLYIWQLASGKLLTIQKRNMRNITVVKFSSNGMLVIVGAEDGTLTTYKLVNLVSLHQKDIVLRSSGQTEPMYTKSDHNQAILDIHVGNLGLRSRIATCSLDKTIKIYKLITGDLLHNIVTDHVVHSFIIDHKFEKAYLGYSNGAVLTFNLPESANYHLMSDEIESKKLNFRGKMGAHTKAVKCLSLNIDGSILASGSDDGTIIVWDTKSKGDRSTIRLNSPVTNLKFIVNHQNIWNHDFEVTTAVIDLDMNFNLRDTNFGMLLMKNSPVQGLKRKWECVQVKEENERLERENMLLRATNQQMYRSAVDLLKNRNIKN